MIAVVCGGAGFVGTNLIERLLTDGHQVVCVDDLSLGQKKNFAAWVNQDNFEFVELDISDEAATSAFFTRFKSSVDELEVWHMAANSDILAGVENMEVDLTKTFLTTVQIIKAMKRINAKRIYFASSSAVYGDFGSIACKESLGPLLPISNYGAMKLASEGVISAAAESFLEHALIFRFPNVVGVPATHGVILDFVRKLQNKPNCLDVLGDGSQRKSYLHISDLVSAMVHLRNVSTKKVDVFNIGATDQGVYVKEIAEQVVAQMKLPDASIKYGKGNKGWVGDVPKFEYSVEKLLKTGWVHSMGSKESVKTAIAEIIFQEVHRQT